MFPWHSYTRTIITYSHRSVHRVSLPSPSFIAQPCLPLPLSATAFFPCCCLIFFLSLPQPCFPAKSPLPKLTASRRTLPIFFSLSSPTIKMKLSTSLLLLAGASTCVSAQWTDYLNKILKTGEKQAPLKKAEPEGHVEDREILIARRVRNVTSENWLSLVQPNSAVAEEEQKEGAAEAEAATAMPTEWYYYFTSSAVNGTKNVTYWDGIFNVGIRIFIFLYLLLDTSTMLIVMFLFQGHCLHTREESRCELWKGRLRDRGFQGPLQGSLHHFASPHPTILSSRCVPGQVRRDSRASVEHDHHRGQGSSQPLHAVLLRQEVEER